MKQQGIHCLTVCRRRYINGTVAPVIGKIVKNGGKCAENSEASKQVQAAMNQENRRVKRLRHQVAGAKTATKMKGR